MGDGVLSTTLSLYPQCVHVAYRGHEHIVSSCTFTPNGHFLCTASWDKSLMLYDVATGEFRERGPTKLVGHEGCISSCACSPDGEWSACCVKEP